MEYNVKNYSKKESVLHEKQLNYLKFLIIRFFRQFSC